jgi:hypothetical protein
MQVIGKMAIARTAFRMARLLQAIGGAGIIQDARPNVVFVGDADSRHLLGMLASDIRTARENGARAKEMLAPLEGNALA